LVSRAALSLVADAGILPACRAEVVATATLTIRGLDDDVRERLRARAAEHVTAVDPWVDPAR